MLSGSVLLLLGILLPHRWQTCPGLKKTIGLGLWTVVSSRLQVCVGDEGTMMCSFGMRVNTVLGVLERRLGVWTLLFYGVCSISG